MKRSTCSKLAAAFALAAASGLTACTSTQDVLEPSALVGGGSAQPASPAFPPAAPTAASNTVAAISTNARVQFAPVVGAPANASTPLAARLSSSAASRGVSLVANGQSSATLIMKGYFSAITERGQTTVIYVWDVVDPAGTRIHRIQGQARAPASGGEGWDGVQAATMETIADETVDRLITWLATQQG